MKNKIKQYFKRLLGSGIQRWLKPCKMEQSLLSGSQEREMKSKMKGRERWRDREVEAKRIEKE